MNTILIQTHDSAFHDSRFNKITEEEITDLTYKINYLRKPFMKKDIIIDFIAGIHGITLYFNDDTQATYLASVMISHFNMKQNEKLNQEIFDKITISLQRKANTLSQIRKIELYECIEI